MDPTSTPQRRPLGAARAAAVAIALSALGLVAITRLTDSDDGRQSVAAPPASSVDPVSIDTMPPPQTVGPSVTVAGSTTLPAAVTVSSRPPAPTIDAKAYAVYDVTAGQWLVENNADMPLAVGSVMKLLTSYVILQAGDLSKVVTVPALDVDVSESSIGLYKGEQLPRDVLFRAMLIVSANDAARTLAIDVGGTTDGFVAQMNAAAATLGLTNTLATNPIGLDSGGGHSSARDMITLAQLLMQNETFRQAVGKPTAKLHGKVFTSTNKLLTTYDGATGVKTGHTTDAGYCLIASATRNGHSYIVAVLGTPTENARFDDARQLLDWAFAG